MNKHTAGPWRATFRGVDQDANWASRIPYAIERKVGNCVQPIADVCDQPEAEANARLLAAAPDLLEALRRCRFDSLNMTLADMDFCRAAIAKAIGEPA